MSLFDKVCNSILYRTKEEKVLACLIELVIRVKGGNNRNTSGICANILIIYEDLFFGELSIRDMLFIIQPIFINWPSYSGNPEYPVPFGDKDPYKVYWNYSNKWVGTYGSCRISLLKYLKETLTENLKK